jgi:hypothetical protein
MSDQNKVVVNNVKKGRRDNLLKGHDRDRPFADIQMPVSFGDRGVESAKDRISVAKRSVIGGSIHLFLIA